MMLCPIACLLFTSMATQAPAPAQAPASHDRSRPATITGRVTDASTGAPLARAIVTLSGPAQNRKVKTLADAEGRFRAAGLPPGTYAVTAAAGEFKATHVAQRGRPPTVSVKAGDHVDVTVPLDPAMAVSGRVVDEAGLPLAHVRIRLRDLTTGQDFYGLRMASTDDRGVFRVFGIPAGRYIVCAESASAPTFDSTAPTGTPRMPAREDRPARATRFVRACYPDAFDEPSAQPVALVGGDVEGLEIRMRRSETFTISGAAVRSDGAAPEGFVLGLNQLKFNGSSGTSREVRGGRFTIGNVVPGRYQITAQIVATPSSSVPLEFASTEVEIAADDVHGLVLTMKKGVSLRGVITFEGTPPNVTSRALAVEVRAARPHRWTPPAVAASDLTFSIDDLFGPVVLSLRGLPPGYAVRSIRYRGRDITGVPTDFDGDPRNAAEIVVTAHVAELSGRVVREAGDPAAAARVIVFPDDADSWRGWMGVSVTDAEGRYTLRDIAPGDYLVVAISAADVKATAGADWNGRNPYEPFARLAERVTLRENDRRVLDLRLTPIPQEWKR